MMKGGVYRREECDVALKNFMYRYRLTLEGQLRKIFYIYQDFTFMCLWNVT